ncbi:hypothetical protein ACWIUD_00605 [Helicobacter sp. 23-1044]
MKAIKIKNWTALAVCVAVVFGFSGCFSVFNDGYKFNLNANEVFGGKDKSQKKPKYEPELGKNTMLHIKKEGVLEIQMGEVEGEGGGVVPLANATLYGGNGKCQTYHYFKRGTSKYANDTVNNLTPARGEWSFASEDTWAPKLITQSEYDKLTTKQASEYESIFGKNNSELGYPRFLYFKSKGCPPRRDGTYKLEVEVYFPDGFNASGKERNFTFELLGDDE